MIFVEKERVERKKPDRKKSIEFKILQSKYRQFPGPRVLKAHEINPNNYRRLTRYGFVNFLPWWMPGISPTI